MIGRATREADVSALVLSGDTPTVPGWWWVSVPGFPLEVVEVYDVRGRLRVHFGNSPMGNPSPDDFPDETRWAGPIPEPEST